MLETTVLVGAAAVAGVAIATGLTRVIVALAPAGIPRLDQVSINLPVAAFTLLVVLMTALLCAWAPVRHAGTGKLAAALGDGGRTTAGTAVHRARSALLVLQIAFAFVLLVSAGLVVRSFAALQRLDLGFEPSPHVLTMSVQPRVEQPPANEWMRELLSRVQGLTGVEAAGGVYLKPLALGPIGMGTWVVVEGQPETPETAAANPVLNYQVATPDYFRAMRIPLKRGRVFTAQDSATSERVAVIGESTATRLWPGQDPIGKRFWTSSFIRGDPKGARRTVVGVVSDVRYRGVDQVHLDVYDPASQTPMGATDLVIRTSADPLALASVVQAEARRLDPGVLVSGTATLEAIVSKAVAPWRFSAWVFSLFAVVSCALSAVGLFSLVSLDVVERRREMAIRIAVGATRRHITAGVVRASAARILFGLSLGMVAAVVGTRALGALLFGVELLDAVTYAAVLLLLTAVVLLASYLPARAAARVDPVELLRG
jgi:putative ABC transport system permease protein